MSKTTYLFLILFSAIVLAVYNTFTLKYHLFYISPLLDIPSHLLGGFVVALVIALVAFNSFKERKDVHLNFLLFFGALAVGILWEIFEVKFNISYPEKRGYRLDTISDLVCDIVGAFVAYLYPIKKLYGR